MPTELLIAVIGSGALSTLISGAFSLLQRRTKRADALTQGLQQLMYDRIKHLCKSYISRGQIASNDLEDLLKMHEAYHRLGGNGFLDELMDAVKELRIIPATICR